MRNNQHGSISEAMAYILIGLVCILLVGVLRNCSDRIMKEKCDAAGGQFILNHSDKGSSCIYPAKQTNKKE